MDETTEINMLYGEFKAFKNEWLKKWRPAIGEGCTGVMTTFFEKLDKFVLTTDYEGLSAMKGEELQLVEPENY
jgi:hypothetical protein